MTSDRKRTHCGLKKGFQNEDKYPIKTLHETSIVSKTSLPPFSVTVPKEPSLPSLSPPLAVELGKLGFTIKLLFSLMVSDDEEIPDQNIDFSPMKISFWLLVSASIMATRSHFGVTCQFKESLHSE